MDSINHPVRTILISIAIQIFAVLSVVGLYFAG